MNLFSKLLGASLLILFSSTSIAQNYYVCDSTGNDNNLGRSEAKPFKTYDKAMANFDKLEAGASILFCRGDTFSVTNALRLVNYKCSASKPCTIGAFGSESLNKPIITTNGVHAINFENGGDSRQDGGYIVENLTLISTQKNGSGVRMFNDVDDVTISNVHIEGFSIGVYAAGSNKIAAGNSANGMNDRLIVKNSTIIKNGKQGFLGSCNDCLFENNHFENNGDTALLDHNIYLAHTGVHAKGITIRNNTLYKSAIVDGKCQGVSLVGHGHLEDVLIEGNTIKEDLGKATASCWGISIDPGYSKVDESFRNIVIRNNKIINVGGNAIGCASCDGVTIEGNEILDEGKLTTAGIKVPVRNENSLKSRNIKIFNNKIVLSNESASGVWVGGENSSKVVGNEIILPTNTRVDCVSLNQASLSIDISTNTCRTHNGVAIIDEKIVDSEEQDLQENENSLPVDDTQVIEVVEPVDESQSKGNGSQIVESDPANDPVYNEQPVQDEQLTNNVEESSSESIVDNSDSKNTDSSGTVLTSTNQNRTNNNRHQDNLNTSETVSSSMSATGTQPRRASDGGSSGGSSSTNSSGSKLASSSNGEQEIITDDIAYFETTQPVINSSNTSILDTTHTESKTIQNSSPSITKMKDVIQASQEDLSNIDPSHCRASANGKCLMR